MAGTCSFGVSIDGSSRAALVADQARSAEDGGAEILWIASHLFLRDPVSLAATALAATRTIKVALMAMSPYAIHPVHIAMAAATLDELYPGRVILSLGAGAPADFGAGGIERLRPLATLRESINLCRSLLAGETPDVDGHVFRVSGRRLDNAPSNVPIVLAASGPKMLGLSGTHADGVIISGATSAPFVRHCLQLATKSGVSPSFLQAGLIYVSIGGSLSEAADRLRRPLGFILRGEHHAVNLQMGGASLDQESLRRAYAGKDWNAVHRLVNDETVAVHAACGRLDQIRLRFRDYLGSGLDHLILGGITDAKQIRHVLDGVQAQDC